MIVRLCPDLALHGVDGDAVRERLSRSHPGLDVEIAPGACEAAARWLQRDTRSPGPFVLAVCRRPGHAAGLEAELCRMGADPRALVIVDVLPFLTSAPAGRTTEVAALLVSAGIARATAFRSSRPESLKPVLAWDGAMSRRAFLSVPAVRYEAIPAVRADRCAAADGCRACTLACPHQALGRSPEGPMAVDATRCTGCGACVSACPEIALELPGAAPEQIDAQILALLSPDWRLGPRGIAFACERALEDPERRAVGGDQRVVWLPIEVPCAGMVTPGWLLGALAMGAAAAAVLPCKGEGCRFGRPETVRGRIDACREILRLAGQPPERAALLDGDRPRVPAHAPDHPASRLPFDREPSLFGDTAGASALLALAGGSRPARRQLTHPDSPFGVVDVGSRCTACGACVQACPSRALALGEEAGEIVLSVDARRCTGCGECAPLCPERAVTVTKAADLGWLVAGRVPLHRTRQARCRACGGAVAPAAMLERIRALLGDGPALPAVTDYCLACRGYQRMRHGMC